jgi:chromosome segregation ATPase
MDFLGKEGEKAAEGVQNLSERLEDVESHLNAVDSALQDVRQESRETDLQIAEENKNRLKNLEQLVLKLTDIQRKNVRETESEESKEIRLEEKVEALDKRLKRTRQQQKQIQKRLEGFETKIDDIQTEIGNVEDELTQEIELNTSRIEPLATKAEMEDEFDQVRQQISRLKTSINALASDLDDDKIRVE